MKLIVGLGNPGKKYKKTRHNIGFIVLDKLVCKTRNLEYEAQNYNLKFESEQKFNAETLRIGNVILVKPQTFMNQSGKAVLRIASFYKVKPENVYVVHDDLDIKLGDYKIQKGIGPKLHYGISSIDENLKTKDYWRVRIGVDNRSESEIRTKGEEYVLNDFTENERETVDDVAENIIVALIDIISK